MAMAEVEKTIPVNAQKFFQVVTDYEKYPQFVDGTKSVKATRNGNEVKAWYDISMMGKDFQYTVALVEKPDSGTVEWSLVEGQVFKKNNGGWNIQEVGANECKVRYWLDVEFDIPVPGFILKGLIKTSLPAMVDQFAKRAQNV